MKYLICANCQHPNVMKSEYQTFCESCGKKFQITFADWRQSHPMATFAEFQQTVGVTIKVPRKNIFTAWVNRQMQPQNRGKVIIFFTLLFICIAGAGTLFGKRAVYTLLYPKVPTSSLYAAWHTATIGRHALEISTPLKLWVHDQPLKPEEAASVEYSKTYRNEDGGGVQIAVNLRSYKPGSDNSLESAVSSSHKALQDGGMVTDIQCKSVPVLISGLQGTLEEGTYIYKGAIKLSFSNLVIVRESSRWQIHINYRDDDPVGQEVAARVLKSVKIK
ncbi:hypothetical protein SAMN05444266_106218 [Chitinophaga jiangningensis]|uniref:Uncharacterized protein n=1 Tax=Chitinophaga jiangningensis TaxID=1419482 RepID=A0A1M7FQ01_9BACT|nr:hypothetical protein [Chitinophaga jiangningensis]SHM05737.1 hypothetical protein SAMN05444266_106218 [Chitinophaga jiangningensis]